MRRNNQEGRSAGGSSLSAQAPGSGGTGGSSLFVGISSHAVPEDACSDDPASGTTAFPVAVSYQDETFCPGRL